jgi:hypothetical protein
MSVDQDWSGGGHGRYKGLPLKKISELFEACVERPSMRSIAAVLRITREQMEARGGLGKQPYYGVFFGVIGFLGMIAALIAPTDLRNTFLAASAGILLAGIAFGYGAWSTRTDRSLNLAQEKEIRDRAGAAIAAMLQHDFDLQPLTREQRDTVHEILKQHPQHAPIGKLLKL